MRARSCWPTGVEDEPGAEDRFKRILGRALNTPPPRKKADEARRKSKHKKSAE